MSRRVTHPVGCPACPLYSFFNGGLHMNLKHHTEEKTLKQLADMCNHTSADEKSHTWKENSENSECRVNQYLAKYNLNGFGTVAIL